MNHIFRFLSALFFSALFSAAAAQTVPESPYELLLKAKQANGRVENLSGSFSVEDSRRISPADLDEARQDLERFSSQSREQLGWTQSVYQSRLRSLRNRIALGESSGYSVRSTAYEGELTVSGSRMARLRTLSVNGQEVENKLLVINDETSMEVRRNQAYIDFADTRGVNETNHKMDEVRAWGRIPNRITTLVEDKVELVTVTKHDGHDAYLVRDPRSNITMGMMDVEYLIVPDYNYGVVQTKAFLAGTDILELEYVSSDWVEYQSGVWRPSQYEKIVYEDDTDQGGRVVKNMTKVSVTGEMTFNVDLPEDHFATVPPAGIVRLVNRTNGVELNFENGMVVPEGGIDRVLANLENGSPGDATQSTGASATGNPADTPVKSLAQAPVASSDAGSGWTYWAYIAAGILVLFIAAFIHKKTRRDLP